MTEIPRFADEAAAHAWFEQCWVRTNEPVSRYGVQTYSLAIVREAPVSKGGVQFLGCLTLFRSGLVAFFSFWVGKEHQDQGVGTRAAQLAHRVARSELGIRHLFTAAFACNWRSQWVLSRVGWALLPFRGEPPADDLVFLHRPLAPETAATPTKLNGMLRALLRDIDSDFVVTPCDSRG